MNSIATDIYIKDCTGCSACKAVCPQQCIELVENEEGFLYPHIDEVNCTSCGKCNRVCCAAATSIVGCADELQFAHAAVTNDDDTWNASASGGAFSEICRAVDKMYKTNAILFCGASMEGLQVFHNIVDSVSKINVFSKSKYIQSDMRDCYQEIKRALKDEKTVVFSGTPCQVYGLRSFLGRKYENLFCIDLICHGVGSPGVFKYCMHDAERRHGKKLKSYTFRYKDVRWGSFEQYTSCYVFDDNSRKIIPMDDYNRLFLNQACLRASCSSRCRFRSKDRQGDITIADFKGKMLALPDVNDYRNYSTIVYNSPKGRKLATILTATMSLYQCSLEHIGRYNPLFCRTTPPNPKRDAFFEDYRNKVSPETLATKYGLKPVKGLNLLLQRMPYGFKRLGFKLLGVMRRA